VGISRDAVARNRASGLAKSREHNISEKKTQPAVFKVAAFPSLHTRSVSHQRRRSTKHPPF
jgi:hypothetical protein